jgi:transcriptional regulator with XRE-family HTH domain
MSSLGKIIRRHRQALGLTQETLASRIGLLRTTVTQIENGGRRVPADELKKIADALNVSTDVLLDPKTEVRVKIMESAAPYHRAPELRISVPRKNAEKFKEVFLYILNRVGAKPNIGETVIYKILYFIDFDYYEKYEEQLIGGTYQKNKFGPTPIEFKKIVDGMMGREVTKVKDKYYDYPRTKYLPLRAPDLKKLTAAEISVIDNVLGRLSDMNAKQISDYSHNDVPWLTTQEGNIIDYESVFYRTPAYSARDYGEIL